MSPEAYQEAIHAQLNLGGRTFDELRTEMLDSKKCYYIEDDKITDVNAPYITVLETAGELWNITFVMQFEKRRAFLHRDLNWYTFTGWTHSTNLKKLWSEG